MPEYLPEGFEPPVYDLDRKFLTLCTLIFVTTSCLFIPALCVDGGDFFFALFGGLAVFAIVKYVETEWKIRSEVKELDDLG